MAERRNGYSEMLKILGEIRTNQAEARAEREFVRSVLGRIASDLESEKGTRARSNSQLFEQISGIRTLIDGDKDGSPGMKGRLQRLEDVNSSRTWHMRAIWVAMLGSVASLLFSHNK